VVPGYTEDVESDTRSWGVDSRADSADTPPA
jgi:hypothetical protein